MIFTLTIRVSIDIFMPPLAPSSSLVRTSASQAENTGSNPVGATSYHNASQGIAILFLPCGMVFTLF